MKLPSLNFKEQIRQCIASKEKIYGLVNRPSFFIWAFFLTTVLLGFCVTWPPNLVEFVTSRYVSNEYDTGNSLSPAHKWKLGDEACNLFKGSWIWDAKAPPLYTDLSCKTLPDTKNCLLHGRRDKDYLGWRWKPDQCQLPIFDPKSFLSIVRGKALAFIGDSVARNQMESLLCLLSGEEKPDDLYKDAKDRFRTWHFPRHNFTLMALWSRFLVNSTQRVFNGSVTDGFDVHLDKIDDNWAQKLPAIDIAIFSDAHWFLKQNYLYEGGHLVGCIYCQDPNVTDVGPGFGIQRAFKATFKYINDDCKDCSGIFTLLRTFSPPHFENGTWKTGGSCLRTNPLAPKEINSSGSYLNYRNIQVAEVEIARQLGRKMGKGNLFGVLDVTEAMLMRPDGHPGLHWRKKKKGYSDCVHWCLPGPIDAWNEFLLEVLRRQFHFPLRSR